MVEPKYVSNYQEHALNISVLPFSDNTAVDPSTKLSIAFGVVCR